MTLEKHDIREEALLNAADYAMLKELSADLGLSKSATLRYCLHSVGNKHIRKKRAAETGLTTEI